MEPVGSLPCQQPPTCPYREPEKSTPLSLILFQDPYTGGKFILVHATEAHERGGGTGSLILNPCSLKLRPLYSRECVPGTHRLGGWVGSTARPDAVQKEISLALAGNRKTPRASNL